eukprot:UN09765
MHNKASLQPEKTKIFFFLSYIWEVINANLAHNRPCNSYLAIFYLLQFIGYNSIYYFHTF